MGKVEIKRYSNQFGLAGERCEGVEVVSESYSLDEYKVKRGSIPLDILRQISHSECSEDVAFVSVIKSEHSIRITDINDPKADILIAATSGTWDKDKRGYTAPLDIEMENCIVNSVSVVNLFGEAGDAIGTSLDLFKCDINRVLIHGVDCAKCNFPGTNIKTLKVSKCNSVSLKSPVVYDNQNARIDKLLIGDSNKVYIRLNDTVVNRLVADNSIITDLYVANTAKIINIDVERSLLNKKVLGRNTPSKGQELTNDTPDLYPLLIRNKESAGFDLTQPKQYEIGYKLISGVQVTEYRGSKVTVENPNETLIMKVIVPVYAERKQNIIGKKVCNKFTVLGIWDLAGNRVPSGCPYVKALRPENFSVQEDLLLKQGGYDEEGQYVVPMYIEDKSTLVYSAGSHYKEDQFDTTLARTCSVGLHYYTNLSDLLSESSISNLLGLSNEDILLLLTSNKELLDLYDRAYYADITKPKPDAAGVTTKLLDLKINKYIQSNGVKPEYIYLDKGIMTSLNSLNKSEVITVEDDGTVFYKDIIIELRSEGLDEQKGISILRFE